MIETAGRWDPEAWPIYFIASNPSTLIHAQGVNKHLLVAVNEIKPPVPAPGTQWDSVIEADPRQHSQKPDRSLELVEAYFPSLPKIELNRRGPARPGWDAWGNEVDAAAEIHGTATIAAPGSPTLVTPP